MSIVVAAAHTAVEASNQNDKPTAIVAYIRDMLQELVRLSPEEAGPMLPYLIDMARQQARDVEAGWAAGRQA